VVNHRNRTKAKRVASSRMVAIPVAGDPHLYRLFKTRASNVAVATPVHEPMPEAKVRFTDVEEAPLKAEAAAVTNIAAWMKANEKAVAPPPPPKPAPAKMSAEEADAILAKHVKGYAASLPKTADGHLGIEHRSAPPVGATGPASKGAELKPRTSGEATLTDARPKKGFWHAFAEAVFDIAFGAVMLALGSVLVGAGLLAGAYGVWKAIGTLSINQPMLFLWPACARRCDGGWVKRPSS
jgi:hypothetical protein